MIKKRVRRGRVLRAFAGIVYWKRLKRHFRALWDWDVGAPSVYSGSELLAMMRPVRIPNPVVPCVVLDGTGRIIGSGGIGGGFGTRARK